MLINKINNLCEVITKDEFHNLMNQLILEHKNLSVEDVFKCLDILGEKFQKFYDSNELHNEESNFLVETLIKLSDFENYTRTESLVSIMFSFRLEKYFLHLVEIVNTNILNERVKQELVEAIAEYILSQKLQ